ncbi:MAG TPA: hypothetical protein VFF36_00185, partial [Planctomycetota bacterium]|nr:hypothetical protein [Planctomycetota bacterium]
MQRPRHARRGPGAQLDQRLSIERLGAGQASILKLELREYRGGGRRARRILEPGERLVRRGQHSPCVRAITGLRERLDEVQA